MNIFETALLRYLKPEQLEVIQQQRIGIAGAGGLGSNIAIILVRTGFKKISILDKDTIEASNLNRQDYTLADIGKPKVLCLKKRLLTINPDLDIITHLSEWSPASADTFFTHCAILVEAFDQAETKTAFVGWAVSKAKFVVSGNGMAGLDESHVTAVKKTGNLYIVGDNSADIHTGAAPLAPRVMQCAAKMAEVILRLALERS
ncbi:MAG: sulfur carrier protein ThiS adenylyltransferase ThiF [Candidatus Omnitrophica bacterium]|nr:sulfur carrier protein ThiS adenylyltransferase ThiF [Candidatus Omnitrophota bacterium]